jgi:hypothetical protein
VTNDTQTDDRAINRPAPDAPVEATLNTSAGQVALLKIAQATHPNTRRTSHSKLEKMTTEDHARSIFEEYYDMLADLTNDFTLQGRRRRVDAALMSAIIFANQMQQHCSPEFHSYWIQIENELHNLKV